MFPLLLINNIELFENTFWFKTLLFVLCVFSSWQFGKYILSSKNVTYTAFGDNILLITRTRILSVCGFALVTLLDFIHSLINKAYQPTWLINFIIAVGFIYIFIFSFKKNIDKALLSKLITTAYFVVLFVFVYRCFEFSFTKTATTQLVCVLLFSVYIFQSTRSIKYLYLLISVFFTTFLIFTNANPNDVWFWSFIIFQTFICLFFYFEIEDKKNTRVLFSNKVLNNTEQFVLVADLKGEFVLVNSYLSKKIGLEPSSLIKNGWWKHRGLSEEEILVVKKDIINDIKNEICSKKINTYHIASQNRTIYIDWEYTPFDGKYMLGIGKDVTQQKIIEEEKQLKLLQQEKNNIALKTLSLKKIENFNSITEFYQEVCITVADVLSIERASIWFKKTDSIVCESYYSLQQRNDETTVLHKNDFPNYITELEKGMVLSIPDVSINEKVKEFRASYFHNYNIKSLLDVPIRIHGELIGVVCCEKIDAIKTWTEQDENFVKSIADLISLNIEADKRREAELSIKQSENNFRLLNETIDDVFWLYDLKNKKVIYKSPSALKVLGHTPTEFYTNFTLWETYVHEDDISMIHKAHETMNESGSFEIEYRIKTDNNEFKWIQEKGFGIKDESGNYTKCSGVCTDITERKAKELIIETQTFDIVSSINYAKRIQNALLPSKHEIETLPLDLAIYYKPKDIIGGDFYWVQEIENKTIIAVGDCTGHGVPGALMTSLGINGLINAVTEQKMTNPADILNYLDDYIFGLLSKTNSDEKVNDGMDIVIISIDNTTKEVQFSGAGRPLYYSKNNEIIKIEGSRKSIGAKVYTHLFETTIINEVENSVFYLFSDGMIDQFGGEKQKRLGSKNFNELLIKIMALPLPEQLQYLTDFYTNWSGKKQQTDDMVWLAIKNK